MDIYFSDCFNIDPAVIEDYGAFNVSLINDLPLFVDPFLLFNSQKPAYQQLHNEIIDYLRFLKERSESGIINDGLLRGWFLFPEICQNWLGYSLSGNKGSGLNMDFAKALHENLYRIFSDFGKEAITRGSHLEKLCLIKNGVGRDKISDFTTNLIKKYLLEYTQTFALEYLKPDQTRKISINKVSFNYTTQTWINGTYQLPFHRSDYVILTPKDILTKDDTWINKTDLVRDFDEIAHSIPNEVLRAEIDQYLIRILPKEPKRKDYSEAVSSIVYKYPQFLDYYIRYKEENGDRAVTLSEQRVKEVELIFVNQLREFITKLNNDTNFYHLLGNTYEEARNRVLFLKDVIENKGGHKLFYDKNGEPIRREEDIHILFRLTWFGTPSDVTREANDGRGPVDYKVSRGAHDKTLVEFKLAKNTHLKSNLEKQVEIYQKASDASSAIKVIVYFTDSEFERVKKILKDINLQDCPDVILIDARETEKPSGSKA
jgi:hypothetical protein